MLIWLSLIAASLVALFVYFLDPGATLEGIPHWVLASAAVAGAGLLYVLHARPRSEGTGPLRIAAILAGVLAAGFGVLYAVQQLALRSGGAETHKSAGEPGPAGAKSVLIRRNEAGRFIAKGEINGRPTDLLIDTGAAVVLLRQSDAEQAGIDVATLKYSVPIETANGTAFAAPVRLRSLAVGPVQVSDLEALVASRGSLNESLLGMSFLRRLRSYELNGDFMTLRE